MKEIKYIMVTSWSNHWDKLQGSKGASTLFTLPLIKDNIADNPLPDDAVTLFIKLTENKTFEKSWIGKTKNFRKDQTNGKDAIRFDVSDLRELECPQQYKGHLNGWHLNKSISVAAIEIKPGNTDANLQPAFFSEMAVCNWQLFEDHCFHLLRLIGIHDIHKFPQSDNRGKADGFFKLSSLSVLYDATLERDFVTQKETQVDNYINQLKGDKVKIGQQSYTVKETNRQVWIITRGSSVRPIRTEDHIKVKEIPYSNLIAVYHQRLQTEIGIEDLWDVLKDLK